MQPDVSTPARFTAVGIENVIRRDTLETGVLIAMNGIEMTRHQGTQDRVQFTNAELLRAAGATFTHNHPGGNGPSVSDVKLGAEFQMFEVRVVTATYRFGVGKLHLIDVDALQAEYDAVEAKVDQALRDDVRCGRVNLKDFGHELVDRAWQRLSSARGFTYWRQQS